MPIKQPKKTAAKKTAAKKAAPKSKAKASSSVDKKEAPATKKKATAPKPKTSLAEKPKPKEDETPKPHTSPQSEAKVVDPSPTPPALTDSNPSAAADDKVVSMKPPIVVKDLAARIGLKPFQVVHQLMEMNVFATLNQTIEEDIATKICEKNGFEFALEKREKGAGIHKVEEVIEEPPPPPPPAEVKDQSKLSPRPPIITFMGHVDHGKTSLLDAIRRTKVAAGEAGGITQHIGAYSIEKNSQTITFLDTPGHAAFTAMRARGATITDIVIIVVAANDGLMPQTIEAIKHAKAANVSIIVAINKIDLPTANPDKVKAQLQEQDLAPEEWGGKTIVCEVSAVKGTGMDNLLEMMLLEAEVMELRAEDTGLARGLVIESQIEVGRGPNATIIVQHGKLKVGDAFICGNYWGKVKALINDVGASVKSAGPSTPVKILGFNGSPVPGEEFVVMKNERKARTLAEERSNEERMGKLQKGSKVTLETLFQDMRDGQKKILPVVLRSDVQGSLEAIIESLNKIPSDKVELNFILSGVGPITVNDVLLAKASNAVILGFNTRTDSNAASASKKEDIQIKLYSIIYELIDQVRDAMAGLLDPEERESHIGKVAVKKVFSLSKFPVAGCVVESGRITKSCRARITRDHTPIYDGSVVTLKRFQDETNEVRAGMECGVRLGDFNDYEEGDIIECYVLEKVAQTLE
ncbi:MAG: translation initiation factor IF-2 [Verrucomicrobiota bacterium]